MHFIMYGWPYRIHHVPPPSCAAAIENANYITHTSGTTTTRQRGASSSDIRRVQGY
jgi:hypothetical protein